MSMSSTYAEAMADAFEDELKKIAQAKVAAMSPHTMKTVGLMGAGAVGYEVLRRAERDRRMGKAMRVQQGY